MSWWGGSVPAGGIVAILQSIGAKGLAAFAGTYAGQALLVAGCLEKVCSSELKNIPNNDFTQSNESPF